MLRVPSPHLVLNAVDPSVPGYTVPGKLYDMDEEWSVPAGASVYDMIDWIIFQEIMLGRLATVIFNCHGVPGKLKIGRGIHLHDLDKFELLSGKTDRIWLIACEAAKGLDGEAFCRELAIRSKARVTASIKDQHVNGFFSTSKKTKGYVDRWEGRVFTYDASGAKRAFTVCNV